MGYPAVSLNAQLQLLPEAWELLEVFQESCTIAQIEFHMAGYAARRVKDQVVVSGSSCSWEQSPTDTAWYELLERVSLVTARSLPEDTRWSLRDWQSGTTDRMASSRELFVGSPQPELWVPAKSNGVAMGQSWQSAAQHALCEIIERHLVLASWYGAIRPQLLKRDLPLPLQALKSEYRIEHYSMGQFTVEGTKIHASATFLWPLNEARPVIYGFGAGWTVELAVERSLKEALQRLCFLYDAEEPEVDVAFRPAPDFHQEFYLQVSRKDTLRRWLSGEHFEERYTTAVPFSGHAHWLDLTPHDHFPGKVVQAFIPGSLPLMFGRYQPQEFSELDPERLIHPIM